MVWLLPSAQAELVSRLFTAIRHFWIEDNHMMQSIPTIYNGAQMRSRLEAKWAAFFDNCGWKWEYEPFDLEGYIPDFVLRLHKPLLVEIKPCQTIQELHDHEKKIKQSGWEWDYIVAGAGLTDTGCRRVVGVGASNRFGEPMPIELSLARCGLCKRITMSEADQSWVCRMCGEHCSDCEIEFMDDQQSHAIWNRSASKVQWKGIQS